jgi:hypothetical protein
MSIVPLRSTESQEGGSPELDFPLQMADPFVRPMHRQCVLKGCAYRSSFLFAAGWGLAALFLLITVVIGIQSARSQEALLKENAFLSQQVNDPREQLAAPSPPASPPPDVLEEKPEEAPAPPPLPQPATPKQKKTAPQRGSSSLPAVPESEKWWNRP